MVTNPLFTLKTMLTAEKLRYLLQILAPLAFLPLRRRYLLLSLVPGAFFTLLTTNYPPTTDIAYQYSAHFVAYIFPAAALALAAIAKQPDGVAAQRAAVATLIMATIICTAHWGAIPPRRNFRSSYGVVNFSPPSEQQKRWGKDVQDLIASVPRSAILAVTDRELPHASTGSNAGTCRSDSKGRTTSSTRPITRPRRSGSRSPRRFEPATPRSPSDRG